MEEDSTEESQTKSITGQSSVTWTTVTTTDTASAQKITVTVSGGCSGESGDTSSFDVILPPVITINSYSPTSYSDPTDPSTINLNFRNSGETVAKDVGITLSLPSGVTNSSGSLSQTESTIDPDENWGTSWTVSFGTVSTSNMYIYITPSNADSKTITIPISVTTPGSPGSPGGPSGPLVGPPDEGGENASKKFELVPGVGLRNNTKLLAAIENVLEKGRLSDQAMENLMRLSASITSDLEVNKFMESFSAKSNITLRVRYRGQRKIRNFMLHENIPKAFASSSDNITVSAPGATYEVVEKDPEYIFLYSEVSPDQELVITYSVDDEVDVSVLDQTETVVFGESYEELAEVCVAGDKRCVGNDLQGCNEDGTGWTKIQTCDYGCDSATLTCTAPPEIPFMEMIGKYGLWIVAVAVIVLVVIAAGVLFKKRKKRGAKLSRQMIPDKGMKPDL